MNAKRTYYKLHFGDQTVWCRTFEEIQDMIPKFQKHLEDMGAIRWVERVIDKRPMKLIDRQPGYEKCELTCTAVEMTEDEFDAMKAKTS